MSRRILEIENCFECTHFDFDTLHCLKAKMYVHEDGVPEDCPLPKFPESKEHGDMSYGELREKCESATAGFNDLSTEIKTLEDKMNANAELQKQIANYVKTRAVYVDYRKSGYSKKYRAEHEGDILIHQAAKKYFDSIGITKLPSVKELRAEYADLLTQKRKAYASYKQARDDMKELYNVKANVDYLLDDVDRKDRQKNKRR